MLKMVAGMCFVMFASGRGQLMWKSSLAMVDTGTGTMKSLMMFGHFVEHVVGVPEVVSLGTANTPCTHVVSRQRLPCW